MALVPYGVVDISVLDPDSTACITALLLMVV